ncbi:MAG: TetR/AcrR family transcriptional regulator [Actinomycetales bacterium]
MTNTPPLSSRIERLRFTGIAVNLTATRRGRPRSSTLDDSIELAALELLASGGFGALTMEAIAARAGVGKASLYRRFANLDDLLARALLRLDEDLIDGSNMDSAAAARQALLETMTRIRARTPDSLNGRIMLRVISEGDRFPQLLAVVQERLLVPRQQRIRSLLDQARGLGLLAPDADIDGAVALLVGPMVWLGMLRVSQDQVSNESVLAQILNGLGSRANDS